jgi:ADP-ribose pyrophosphatase YjhB (NUDIX family)
MLNNAAMSHLADFLSAHAPQAHQDVRWGEQGELRLHVTTYLCDRLPPRELVTSARAVVLRNGCVLVVRDPVGVHILPGGRREPDETLEQTVHREVLEETGWAVAVLGLLGVLRFRHRSPKPAGYAYPYPEFYQAVYRANAASFHAQARQGGGYELTAGFQPVPAVRHLALTPGEQVLLRAALASEAFRQFQ